jgi:hypothetical protein
MSETMSSVVKKVVLAAEQMGLLVTEAQAREAIACVNDEYVINV